MVKGNRASRREGYGIEVPLEYLAYGHNKALKLLEKSVYNDVKLVDEITKHALKKQNVVFLFYFFFAFIAPTFSKNFVKIKINLIFYFCASF